MWRVAEPQVVFEIKVGSFRKIIVLEEFSNVGKGKCSDYISG